MSYLALKTKLSPRQYDYLNKIRLSADALLGIINDILDYSKIEAGKLVLEQVPFELEAVLGNVVDINSLAAEEKNLEFLVDVDDTVPMTKKLTFESQTAADTPRVIIGDRAVLLQILTNLLDNAVKFTLRGTITLLVQPMRFSSRWTAAICYDALARCAVPIFLMITGYLLLDYEEPFWRFYRKRCIRVLLPFVAYCVLYLAVDHVPIASWLHRIYIGSVAPHFWYIYELIGIYLFLPFLRKIYIHSSKGERLTYVAFWLAWSIIFPTIQKFFDLRHSPIGIYHLDKFTGYTGYVFIGAVFKQYMPCSRQSVERLRPWWTRPRISGRGPGRMRPIPI